MIEIETEKTKGNLVAVLCLVLAVATFCSLMAWLIVDARHEHQQRYDRHVQYNTSNIAACEKVGGAVILNSTGWYKDCVVPARGNG